MSVTVRFQFARRGPVRYLGHLDMLRYFQKAVMRSQIPAKYTEGFHPHQIMSFAYPLGVAMETDGDYMDLELTEEAEAAELCDALNAVMHEGIWIRAAAVLPPKAAGAMASVAAADYELRFEAEASGKEGHLREMLMRAVEALFAEEELLIGGAGQEETAQDTDSRRRQGKGKKEKKTKDIRPGIVRMRVDDAKAAVYMRLLSGSALNVRPADVCAMLMERMPGEDITLKHLIRKEIYGMRNGKFVPLLQLEQAEQKG
ncbi:MAG: TIGR03936 family radical SAM-associated protein [Lachnospiraceae bacterium]|nr:TIGR03936 family radical SAM-associated protein [Lachnospiraceae bacterium]